MKIFLLGFMGCGKSTTGQLLAQQLGIQFADIDRLIEEKTGTKIPDIFHKQGEQTFRQIEKNALAEVALCPHDTVIATGGGTPCSDENIRLINQNGISVYLKMSAENLTERLRQNTHNRPLINNIHDREILRTFIKEKLNEREKWYRQAHYIIKAKNLVVSNLASFICQKTQG